MKPYLFIIVLVLGVQYTGSSQCVINGGFEHWDSTYYTVSYPDLTPIGWTWALPNTPCYPVNFLVTSDTSAHSGNLSAMLESKTCVDDLGNDRLEEGMLFSGGPYFTPRNIAFPCTLMPSELRFHYKFHQEGNDSAYVKLLLFNYDSITPGLIHPERIDTIAFSSGYIHQEATDFTPFSLPVTYLNSDTPAFMQVFFSTSKTLSEHFGNTPPFLYAYPGTTLWIDDVYISGGNVGVAERELNAAPLFYPNPADALLHFREPALTRILAVTLTDMQGRLVLSTSAPPGSSLDISNMTPGLYLVRCDLAHGPMVMEKLLVR